MLERLADMLRVEDSRGGFEAKADMLSITGMTLEQFADLMQGLGYKAEKGEREKVKPVAEAAPAEAPKEDAAAEETPAVEAEAPAEAEAEAPAEAAADAAPETEGFVTFTWGGDRQNNRGPRRERGGQQQGGRRDQQGDKPRGKGKPKGKGGPRRDNSAKSFQARPPKKEKAIDPDNPFAAALMGLKEKG
jgi:ATP-dependent RNA helicase SUPV3L1/SUV3